jgi:hypothetical protein
MQSQDDRSGLNADSKPSNCKGLVVLMLTITILAFVLGGLLGLIANVGVLIFAIASLGGKSTLCVSLAVAAQDGLTHLRPVQRFDPELGVMLRDAARHSPVSMVSTSHGPPRNSTKSPTSGIAGGLRLS